ncbi:MFS transporter [Paenibacillus sp. 32352]|uniref:MFS transporter n=1 Tax=Paenibacillus sp. 32352 TaxID=1969111 RepID=UPI0021182075|nr:MFS transporter [Paenibacillus sp. 32352]
MEKLEQTSSACMKEGARDRRAANEDTVGINPHLSASSVSRRTALTFAVACGMAVAGIYYAQPLLDAMSNEFGIAPSTIGVVITVTQVCYALGLILLVPLGDLLNQRRLILGQMLLLVLASSVVGLAPTGTVLFAGIALVGLLAVVTQTLVAFAAALASPHERGRVIGLVTSGIVIGILLARTVAGLLTDLAGWRSVYLVSASLMLLMVLLLFRALPKGELEDSPLSYWQLLRSVLLLFVEERTLRIRGLLAFFIFTAFSILWTSLVLPLSAPPLSLSHSAIGAFGLAGAAGALAAAKAGKWADRGLGQWTTGVALILLLASWGLIRLVESSLWILIVGVIILDFAVQAVHVTNQSMILSVRPESRSRLTAAYMIFYSVGSATGSIASTLTYSLAGWSGVCILGSSVSACAIIFWAWTRTGR